MKKVMIEEREERGKGGEKERSRGGREERRKGREKKEKREEREVRRKGG